MFLKLFIFSFLSLPLKNVRIEQTDVDFNNALNSVVTTVGAIGYFVPKLLRNNEICRTDDDCPLIMRCCEIGIKKYCCTPNNFVKMSLAFQDQEIQPEKE